MTHALVLDFCSLILGRNGARPVPRAAASFTIPQRGAVPPPCPSVSCDHNRWEHGATGECWYPGCECGQPTKEPTP